MVLMHSPRGTRSISTSEMSLRGRRGVRQHVVGQQAAGMLIPRPSYAQTADATTGIRQGPQHWCANLPQVLKSTIAAMVDSLACSRA